jgi:hypothetical protein
MCTLYIQVENDEILITSWTARSIEKGLSVDIAFTWGDSGFSWFATATGVARVKLKLPFKLFMKYVQECQSSGAIANLSEEGIRRLVKG